MRAFVRVSATIALVAVIALIALPAHLPVTAQAPPPRSVHHDLRVVLEPATSTIRVTDRVALPAGASGPVEFALNARLRITKAEPDVREATPRDGRGGGTASPEHTFGVKRYRVVPPNGRVISLTYAGPIDFALSPQKEEYTRGFRETPGRLADEGVYLAGATAWYPQLAAGDDFVTFTLDVQAPMGWHVISEGAGSSGDGRGRARWEARDATDEIHLVGGPLVVARRAGPVETLVYLHENDVELAGKYLEASSRYIEMYGRLIGLYPYAKFAVVENFWDTGYGMPSFTLLGPQVIRFPFILTSSLPHEILHNWWGNSVFVDYASGNWCEGLTAYLADHLLQEQQGKGAEYRRGALQRYRDYVKEGRDFPLSAFRARESAATEAVGYGKSMMVFHMLRRQLGDGRFTDFLARLYRGYRGKRASWADVGAVAETLHGQPLGPDFELWLSRSGAPSLGVKLHPTRRLADNRSQVSGMVTQTQVGPPYRLDVPLLLQCEGGVVNGRAEMASRSADFTLTCSGAPLALTVDPYFDVFRLLDARETPASVGQIFGDPRIVALLPSAAPRAVIDDYRSLVESWQSASHSIEVELDSGVTALPADRSVWLFGRENRFATVLFERTAGVSIEKDAVVLDGKRVPTSTSSAVMIVRHPGNVEKVVGWVIANPVASLPALGRKLPHYGKYSYLAFQGADATNTMSGQWQSIDSPLRVDLRPEGQRAEPLPSLPADPSKPLVR